MKGVNPSLRAAGTHPPEYRCTFLIYSPGKTIYLASINQNQLQIFLYGVINFPIVLEKLSNLS